MPSKKPLIGLRLSKAVHERLLAAAAADSRTPTNYIEQLLKRTFGIVSTAATRAVPAVAPVAAPRPVAAAPVIRPDPPVAAVRGLTAEDIYRQCFGEPPDGMYDENGETIERLDTNMEDDSIDANDGTDDIDADSAQEESEPNPDRTDARPH